LFISCASCARIVTGKLVNNNIHIVFIGVILKVAEHLAPAAAMQV
jgi:hypothetical protein